MGVPHACASGCPMIYLIVITSSAMALMADIHAKGRIGFKEKRFLPLNF